MYRYSPVVDITLNVSEYNYYIILDKMDSIYWTNILEDTLTSEDYLTRLYTLEELRGLD